MHSNGLFVHMSADQPLCQRHYECYLVSNPKDERLDPLCHQRYRSYATLESPAPYGRESERQDTFSWGLVCSEQYFLISSCPRIVILTLLSAQNGAATNFSKAFSKALQIDLTARFATFHDQILVAVPAGTMLLLPVVNTSLRVDV